MTDRKVFNEPAETPEDVATLYSWANLHGAKYRDFSASRAQTREKARQRVQEAIDAERRRVREEEEAQMQAEAQRQAEAAHMAEAQRQAQMRAEQEAADRVAQAAARVAAQQAAQQAAQPGAWPPGQGQYAVPAQSQYAAPGQYPPYPAAAPYSAPNAPYPAAPAYPAAAPAYYPGQPAPYPQHAQPQGYAPLQAREENFAPVRNAWAGPESREGGARPAWLAADRSESAGQPLPQAPEDTLQGSRDRITSRWFALKGVFAGGATAPAEPLPAPSAQRAPVLAVFSLAGGVGKTSLVATLGRALSARGERVLLVDTAAYGLLPFFFGARDQRLGVLRTFSPPGNSGDAPIQMLTVDAESLAPEGGPQEPLAQEVLRHGRGASRILIDLATASGAITRRVLRMSPTALVPVIPDMSSVVSVGSIDSFFQRNGSGPGQPVLPFYVLNQFDPSLPLHLDVREVLREQLGDRLLPFSLRRTAAVSEALAEGMTVVDYAPNSTVAEDFGALAAWVKSLAAPASSGFRGVRWSER
ncbi:MAG TPA: cellulose synthase operon protein YhjQ/BcsQ [Terracidiphilus sp.]|jgi:cellulose synthase operon protein YhjQ|nr:cellulose synthase operon protein YhjQ/BcsQ [Terracidiphilus sp.]